MVNFEYAPNGQNMLLLMEAITYRHKDAKLYKSRKMKSTKSATVKAAKKPSENLSVLEVKDVAVAVGTYKKQDALKKILLLLLIAINKELAHEDQTLIEESVKVPIKRILELGIYATEMNARHKLKDMFIDLEQLRIRVGKGKTTQRLFKSVAIKKGYLVAELNIVNWDFLATNTDSKGKYWTVVPDNAFALNDIAFTLYWYIMHKARKTGKANFEITMQQAMLITGLPDINRNAYKLIKKPLKEAIEVINADKLVSITTNGISWDSNINSIVESGKLSIEVGETLKDLLPSRATKYYPKKK